MWTPRAAGGLTPSRRRSPISRSRSPNISRRTAASTLFVLVRSVERREQEQAQHHGAPFCDLCTERALCSAVYRRELCVRAQKMYYSNESHSNLRRNNNRPRARCRWNNGLRCVSDESVSTDDCVVLVRGAQAARRMLFINKSNFIYHAPHEVTLHASAHHSAPSVTVLSRAGEAACWACPQYRYAHEGA